MAICFQQLLKNFTQNHKCEPHGGLVRIHFISAIISKIVEIFPSGFQTGPWCIVARMQWQDRSPKNKPNCVLFFFFAIFGIFYPRVHLINELKPGVGVLNSGCWSKDVSNVQWGSPGTWFLTWSTPGACWIHCSVSPCTAPGPHPRSRQAVWQRWRLLHSHPENTPPLKDRDHF